MVEVNIILLMDNEGEMNIDKVFLSPDIAKRYADDNYDKWDKEGLEPVIIKRRVMRGKDLRQEVI